MDKDVSLKFEEIKKIQFGDLKVMPQMNQELELRVRGLNPSTEEGIEEAKDVLSSCFGDNKDAVRKFMDANMKGVNLSVLQAYLVGGKQAVDMVLDTATKGTLNA